MTRTPNSAIFIAALLAFGAMSWPSALMAQRPVILQQPRDLFVAEHDTATFTAVVGGGTDFTSVIWHMSSVTERPHQIPDDLGFDVHDTTLRVPDCLDNGSYNGVYWLAVTNSSGGTVTRHARLTVVLPPLIIGGSESRTVHRGAFITLFVTTAVDHAPSKHYEWFKDGNSLHVGRLLPLRNLQPSDSGEYTCVVTTLAGTTSGTVTITVAN